MRQLEFFVLAILMAISLLIFFVFSFIHNDKLRRTERQREKKTDKGVYFSIRMDGK